MISNEERREIAEQLRINSERRVLPELRRESHGGGRMTQQERTEYLEYIHALEAALIQVSVPARRHAAVEVIVVLRERFAPTVSAGLYDWEGRDVR